MSDQATDFSSKKIVALNELVPIIRGLKKDGRRIVLTNGIFDLLHLGHVRYLQEAKSLGDILIVGLNSDRSARSLKGKKRPIVPQVERAEILAALQAVDYVLIFDEDTAEGLVRALEPHIYVKGGDWSPESLPEAQAVAKCGAEVRIFPLSPGLSTSELIKRIVSRFGGGG